MGLDIYVSGATMSHQMDEDKYFRKRLFRKELYNHFDIEIRKASGVAWMFKKYGKEFDEDRFYVKRDDVLRLMNEELQKNPFDYNNESYDTVGYYYLMAYLEGNRGRIESTKKDEFILVFELSY